MLDLVTRSRERAKTRTSGSRAQTAKPSVSSRPGRKVKIQTSARHTTSPVSSPIPDDVASIDPVLTSETMMASRYAATTLTFVPIQRSFELGKNTTLAQDRHLLGNLSAESGLAELGLSRERLTPGLGGHDLNAGVLRYSILESLLPQAQRSHSALPSSLRRQIRQGHQFGVSPSRTSRPKTTSSAASCFSTSRDRKRPLGADLYPVLDPCALDRERALFRSGMGVLAGLLGNNSESSSARRGDLARGRYDEGDDYFCRASRAEAAMNNAHVAKIFHFIPQRAGDAGDGFRPVTASPSQPAPRGGHHRRFPSAPLCHRRSSLAQILQGASIPRPGSPYTKGQQASLLPRHLQGGSAAGARQTEPRVHDTSGSGVGHSQQRDDEREGGVDSVNESLAESCRYDQAKGHSGCETIPRSGSLKELNFFQARQQALRGVNLKQDHSAEWLEETKAKQEESVSILTEHLRLMLDAGTRTASAAEDGDTLAAEVDAGVSGASDRQGSAGLSDTGKKEPAHAAPSTEPRRAIRLLDGQNNVEGFKRQFTRGQHKSRPASSGQTITAKAESALQKVAVTGRRLGEALEAAEVASGPPAGHRQDSTSEKHQERRQRLSGRPKEASGLLLSRVCMKTMSCEVLGPATCQDCSRVRQDQRQRQEQAALYPGLAVDPRSLVAGDRLRSLNATLPDSLRRTGHRLTLPCGCVVGVHPDFLFPALATDRQVHARLMLSTAATTAAGSSSIETAATAATRTTTTAAKGSSSAGAEFGVGEAGGSSVLSDSARQNGSGGSQRDGGNPQSGRAREISGSGKNSTKQTILDEVEQVKERRGEKDTNPTHVAPWEKEDVVAMSPADLKVTVRYTSPSEQGHGPSVFITNSTPEPGS